MEGSRRKNMCKGYRCMTEQLRCGVKGLDHKQIYTNENLK